MVLKGTGRILGLRMGGSQLWRSRCQLVEGDGVSDNVG